MSQRENPIARSVLKTALDANRQRIVNVADPVEPHDAVTKEYLEQHGAGVAFDDEPTEGSQKAARSGGIFAWVKRMIAGVKVAWSDVTDKPTIVKTVNSMTPDVAGDVELSASDVGALSKDGKAKSAEYADDAGRAANANAALVANVASTALNADKLGGHEPGYFASEEETAKRLAEKLSSDGWTVDDSMLMLNKFLNLINGANLGMYAGGAVNSGGFELVSNNGDGRSCIRVIVSKNGEISGVYDLVLPEKAGSFALTSDVAAATKLTPVYDWTVEPANPEFDVIRNAKIVRVTDENVVVDGEYILNGEWVHVEYGCGYTDETKTEAEGGPFKCTRGEIIVGYTTAKGEYVSAQTAAQIAGLAEAASKVNHNAEAEAVSSVTLKDGDVASVTMSGTTLAIDFDDARADGGLRMCELCIIGATKDADLTFAEGETVVADGNAFPKCEAGLNYYVFAEVAPNTWNVTRKTLQVVIPAPATEG